MIKTVEEYLVQQSSIFVGFITTVGDIMSVAEFEGWNDERIRVTYANAFEELVNALMAHDGQSDIEMLHEKLMPLMQAEFHRTKVLTPIFSGVRTIADTLIEKSNENA